MFWYPRFIYEVLPYVYFLIGVVCVFTLEPFLGKLAGGLLAVAAVTINRLRRAYRKGF